MSLGTLLPILEELLHSSLWLLLAFSAAAGFFIVRTLRPRRQVLYCLTAGLAVWLLCELVFRWVHGFLPELLILFAGTIALGAAVGSGLAWLEYRIRKRL